VEDRILLTRKVEDEEVATALENQKEYIAKETLTVELNAEISDYEYEQTVKMDGKEVWFGISRKTNKLSS
jgi:hypothetical protein